MSLVFWNLAQEVAPGGGVMPRGASQSIMFWCGVLIVIVVVGGGAILLLRRFLKDPTAGVNDHPGFSLSDLRDMRDRGEITSEEYEQTRARVVEKVKKKMGESPPKSRQKPSMGDEQ